MHHSTFKNGLCTCHCYNTRLLFWKNILPCTMHTLCVFSLRLLTTRRFPNSFLSSLFLSLSLICETRRVVVYLPSRFLSTRKNPVLHLFWAYERHTVQCTEDRRITTSWYTLRTTSKLNQIRALDVSTRSTIWLCTIRIHLEYCSHHFASGNATSSSYSIITAGPWIRRRAECARE